MSEHVPLEDLERACLVAADHVIASYGWRLLDRDELARRACDLVRTSGVAQPLSAAVGAYCVALHAACSGGQGVSRQEQGYLELSRYLIGMARARYRDLPEDVREDVAQSALERIFRGLDRCRAPVAFLAFAAQHLLDAARVARRSARRPVDSLERVFAAPDAPVDEPAAPDQEPGRQAIDRERSAALDQLFRELVAAHPRAAKQVVVLRLALIEELDDAEIGRRLGLTPGGVWAARSRILKTIQSEPRWRARARELGLLPDEV